ncbi:hypothetical protein EWB00_005959 [Schistosoma japonicum]|uniref:Uncharacterized protein n=1 Tax=Schistosoma japonicum TaxID=6182 RepID=A0A4Z2DT22_SCHJA|nr:hypothetical protein EWB00_005959 [Schistosoma japonicum]
MHCLCPRIQKYQEILSSDHKGINIANVGINQLFEIPGPSENDIDIFFECKLLQPRNNDEDTGVVSVLNFYEVYSNWLDVCIFVYATFLYSFTEEHKRIERVFTYV